MRLVSLELENYRRYQRLELEFPEGVVAIVGRNGSGKSTLLESVAWALYGNKPEIVRAGKESLKWVNAPKGEGVRAVLRFRLEGQEYSLERTLKDASLTVEDKLLAKGLKPVEEKVSDLLHMEYKEFSASIYARQKELDLLSQQRPEERRRLIHRMLGITAVEEARSMARGDRRRLEQQMSGATTVLYEGEVDQIESIQKEKTVLEENDKTFQRSVSDAEGELKQARERLASVEISLEAIEVKRKKTEAFKKELSSLDSAKAIHARSLGSVENKITQLEERGKEVESLAPLEKEYRSLRKLLETLDATRILWDRRRRYVEDIERLTSAEKKANTALEGLHDVSKEITQIESELSDVKKKDKAVGDEIKSLTSLMAKLEQKKEALRDKIKGLKTHLKEIERLGEEGVCPTCERPLEGHSEILEQKYRSETETLGSQISELEETLAQKLSEEEAKERLRSALSKKMSRLDKDLRDLERSSTEANIHRKALDEAGAQKSVLERKLAELGTLDYDPDSHSAMKTRSRALELDSNKYIRLKEALDRLPVLKEEKEAIEKTLAENKQKHVMISDELGSVGFDEEAYKSLSLENKELAKKDRSLTTGLFAAKEKLSKNSASLVSLLERLERLKEAEKKLEGWKEEIRYLHRLAGSRPTDPAIFSDFLTELTNRIRPVLRSHATELFNIITENRYGGLEIDEDYSIAIYDALSEPLAISRFSGGEEDVANLCLRIAVSRALSERSGALIDYIILDEIFGSQDVRRRENIMRALDKLSGVFRQVFVITHIESVKDHVSYIIRVEEMEDGSSIAIVE